MPAPITCTVVSPEETLFEGLAERVVVPGAMGEIGVYPRHAPIVAQLGVGVVRLHLGEEDGSGLEVFAIRGGVMQVAHNKLMLLVTVGMRPEDASADEAQAKLEAVKQSLQSPASAEEYEELLVERHWLEVQIRLHELATPEVLARLKSQHS